VTEAIAFREIVKRNPPVNLTPVDTNLFCHEFSKELPETYVGRLEKIRVLPNGYLAGKSPLSLRNESFANPPKRSQLIKSLLKSTYLSMVSSELPALKRALFITDEFSNGFFHWFGDVLPKLELLISAYGSESVRAQTLVIPAMADFPYVSPSLEPFKLTDVLFLGERESIHCESLLTSSPAAPTGNYRPALMKALRDRFLSYFGSSKSSNRKIFISRSQAPKRRIANEDELAPILERAGFEIVLMERLSFADQVKLLSETSVLIGNHGAGLINMLFMRANSSIVELRLQGDSANNCFYSLSSALEHSYRYQLCDTLRPGEDAHTADFVVDAVLFTQLLKAF